MRNNIILILVLSFCLSLGASCEYKGEIPFEREKWQAQDAVSYNTSRPAMARNLINRNLLAGKTKNEIREMLGKSNREEQNKISYELEEKYWGIDPVSIEWLEITFNQEYKVEKAEITFYKIG